MFERCTRELTENHRDRNPLVFGPIPARIRGITGAEIHGPKPYKSIGFGSIQGPKPYKFTGFGDIHGPNERTKAVSATKSKMSHRVAMTMARPVLST